MDILINKCADNARRLAEAASQLATKQTRSEKIHRTNAELTQEKTCLEKSTSKHIAACKTMEEEKRKLLQQLDLVQYELETLYLQSRQRIAELERERNKLYAEKTASDRKLAKVTSSLTSAQSELETLVQVNEHLSSKLREQEKVLNDSQNHSQALTAELTERNVQLQDQLLEIQSDLEKHHLANREMHAVMTNSAHAMHRARIALVKTLLND